MKVFISSLFAVIIVFCSSIQSKELTADSGFATKSLSGCKSDLRYLNQVIGWQVKWPRQWQNVIASGPTAANDAMTNWSEVPTAIEQAIATLRLGLTTKQTAPRAVLLRVHQQVRDLSVALNLAQSKYTFDDIDDKIADNWNRLIRDEIAPSVLAFEQFLAKEYLPLANTKPGLSHLDDGEKCFFAAVKWWTTLNLTQEEIEAIGQKYLDDSANQLLATGQQGATLKSMLSGLRNQVKEKHTIAKELVLISEQAIARAQDNTLQAFTRETSKEIKVSEMPKYMQDSAPAGYYARANGETPARYIINPSRPNERRLMAEVIAFHEGVPGHHLWSTYPRENASTGYNSGILEGWALYSEYLADEMGLYSSTYDRQGMITKHLWAASRLIVEPGIHLRGWSREEAIDFMLDNTVMSRTEIAIEVDRYIAMPGQSLSYMLGADVILSERERAQHKLGSSFNLAAFHEVILAAGVRPLPQVIDDIQQWIEKVFKIKG